MTKYTFVFLFFIFFIASKSFAQDRGLGLGVKIGEPTGITLKYWTSEVNAVDFSLGYSLINDRREIYLSCDYLYHIEDIIRSHERLPLYYGFGARFLSKENQNSSLGVRGVGGVAWFSRDLPVDVFFELAPVFKLFPSTSLDFEAGFGARYFF
ncbi:MAG: hypothetical protein ACM34K_12890 [Bacillota bacterium]